MAATLKTEIAYSRKTARELIKKHYNIKSLLRIYHVHHKDLNPFNNEITNLEILTVGEHLTLHRLLAKRELPTTRGCLICQLRELEALLFVCNTFGYGY